jgi:hypothetical protein
MFINGTSSAYAVRNSSYSSVDIARSYRVCGVPGEREMLRYLSEYPEYFDPETLDVMIRALDEAWERAQGSGFQLDRQAGAARTALAKHIVDMARQGERDSQRLVEGALVRLKL